MNVAYVGNCREKVDEDRDHLFLSVPAMIFVEHVSLSQPEPSTHAASQLVIEDAHVPCITQRASAVPKGTSANR